MDGISVNFMQTIKRAQFNKAHELVKHFSYDDLYDFIISLGFSEGSIALYSFAQFLIQKNESAGMHLLGAVLICQAFSHVEGSCSAGLFHARRAVELEPTSIGNKEYLLFFYGIPDRLLPKDEATRVAHEVLFIDPNNIAAIATLNTIEKDEKARLHG